MVKGASMLVKAICVAAVALSLAAGVANADPAGEGPSWGSEVKGCVKNSSCYGGGSRGSYVNEQARDGDGPGYGREIHDLAKPGASDPNGGPLS